MHEFSLRIDSSKREKLALNIFEPINTGWCILFVHGGATDVGKDRFKDWQKDFAKEHIGSVAFDFIGVGESVGDMTQESLLKRVEDTQCVALWMKERYPNAKFAICGVSMGGHVALDVVHRMPDLFAKLAIQVPAAYSSKAQDLKFDETFTQELRKPNSWKDSNSFRWLQEYPGGCLLIACKEDKTIPRPIIETYKSIGEEKENFTFVDIEGAPHNIWKAVEGKERIVQEAYGSIRRLLQYTGK